MIGGQRHNPKEEHRFYGSLKVFIATNYNRKYRRLFSTPTGPITEDRGHCNSAHQCSKVPTLIFFFFQDQKATKLGRTTDNLKGHKWKVLVDRRDHWRGGGIEFLVLFISLG